MSDTANQKSPELSPHPKRMPLFIIKLFLFAALLMLGVCFYAISFVDDVDNAFEMRTAELVQELGKLKQPGEVTMVTMGDSRFRYALRKADDPAVTMDLPDGRTLRSLKLSTDNASFAQYKSLQDVLLEVRPDILVLQKTLLFRHPGANLGKLEKIRKLPSLLLFRAALFGQAGGLEWEHQHSERICLHNYSRGIFEQRIRRHYQMAPPDPNGQIALDTRDFLRTMLDAGVKVVILKIPPNDKAVKRLGLNPIKMDNMHLDREPEPLELLPEDIAGQLEWIDYPGPEKIRAYCDLIHMNEKSSDEFTEWLKEQVVKLNPIGL